MEEVEDKFIKDLIIKYGLSFNRIIKDSSFSFKEKDIIYSNVMYDESFLYGKLDDGTIYNEYLLFINEENVWAFSIKKKDNSLLMIRMYYEGDDDMDDVFLKEIGGEIYTCNQWNISSDKIKEINIDVLTKKFINKIVNKKVSS